MASVTKEKNGYRITWRDGDKRRRRIRVGGLSKRQAESIAAKVQDIVGARVAGEPISTATAQWLVGLGEDLKTKLADAGLIEQSSRQIRPDTLDAYIEHYIERKRPTVEPQTLQNYVPFRKVAVEYFGVTRKLKDVSAGDADDFRTFLLSRYAEATMSKRIKQAREIFRQAVKDRIIETSPFADVETGSESNDARRQYVLITDVETVIEQCPDAQWRLIIALSRFAGLRTPSETFKLRWQDIDWDKRKILIHSPKTKRQGKPTRWIPLWPELEPYLTEAFELARDGDVYCITRYRLPNANLRTQLHRYIEKAGLQVWPRAFHNMRASLQTDLNKRYEPHVVAYWLGNTVQVADRHYNMTTDEHFARAIAEGGARGGAAIARSDSQVPDITAVESLQKPRNAEFVGIGGGNQYPREDSNL